MWRAGRQQRYRTAGGRGEPVGPQVVAVAVAIDGDKSSQQALKWAADHVLRREHIFFLLHVRRYTTTIPTPTGHQIPISEVEEEVASAFLEQMDLQTKRILLPFQCYCSRRGVEVLSCIRHPNMVLLMGACPEYGCLVYEYMANGSLEDRLFCRSGTSPLSWQLRFKIAAEIASGLIFLHQTKPEPFVHRDLKPGNILLDHDYVSKIADVGLARLIPSTSGDSATQYHITAAAGTFCYIDPEYQKTGMLGIKSDIYALGIILLQLITAQSAMGIAHNVERAIQMDKFKEIGS